MEKRRPCIICILTLLFALPTFAIDDANQYLGDSLEGESPIEREIREERQEKIEEEETFRSRDFRVPRFKKEEKNFDFTMATEPQDFVPGDKDAKDSKQFTEVENMPTEKTENDKFTDTGYKGPGKYERDQNYLEYKTSDILASVYKKSNWSYTATLFSDNYIYEDEASSFKPTYRDSGSETPGMLTLVGHYFFYKSEWLELAAGAGAGIGYNSGVGRFIVGRVKSEARFFLWTAPVDASFMVQFTPFRYLKLAFSGGPSVLGIWQHRSDLGEKDPKKDIRQMGFGYHYTADLKISTYELMGKTSLGLLNSLDVTRTHLVIMARGHYYDRFRDRDVRIHGISFGVGINAEYF